MLDRLLGRSWSDSASGPGSRSPPRRPADHRSDRDAASRQRAAFGLLGLLWAPLLRAPHGAGGVHVGVSPPVVGLRSCSARSASRTRASRSASAAADRRRGFRHALGAFLDVVAVSLASGRGVDTALRDGVPAGPGWPFAELERALSEARLLGESPWTALARLSRAIGVPELAELAASAALAGNEGARVRSSLAAKARAIRVRGLAEVERRRQSATERMTLPSSC